MTFRDAQIHRLLRIDRAQVPMNALMTHGLIRGRHEGASADRDLNDWADYVMMFLGRGVMLQELYITPSLLADGEWRILGAALRWAHARSDALKHTRMIGGRPDAGEPYGYAHWSPAFGVVCLRNPSPRPTDFMVPPLARRIDGATERRWRALQIYPSRRTLVDVDPHRPWPFRLNGHEVAVVEIDRENRENASWPGLGDACPPTRIIRNEPDRLDWRLEATSGRNARTELCWWSEPAHGALASLAATETSTPRTELSSSGWSLHRRPLKEGEPAALTLKLPWSPFWPQQTKASAVVRTVSKRPEPLKEEMPYAIPLPEVRPSHVGAEIEETLVLDAWRFHRRRSLPERLGWLLALGVAPLGLMAALTRRIGSRTGRPRLVGVVAAAALISLYALTPLGAALGRALGEL